MPGWDGMVYWINAHAYLQGAPLYEYSQAPAFSLFLAILQMFGLSLSYAYTIEPVLTGFGGFLLYSVLRGYTRDWLAALGSIVFLSTAIVEYWSTTLLTHGFATCFLLAGFYCLNIYSFKRLILGASCLSLAVFTSFPLVLVVLPFLVLFAARYRKLIDLDAVTVGGILPLVPFLLSFPTGLFDISRQIYAAIVNANSLIIAGVNESVVSPMLYFNWILNNLIILIPLLVLGIYSVFDKRKAWFFGLYLFIYLLGFTLFSDREQRLVFELTPALAALIILGGEHVLQNMHNIRGRYVFTSLLLILVAGYAVNQALYVLPNVQATSGIGVKQSELYSLQLIGLEISNHTASGAIVVAEHEVPWLTYYSSRYVYLVQLTNIHDPTTVKTMLSSLHPHPVLLVVAPALGDDIGFLGSLQDTRLVTSFNAPTWGQVYLFQVTIP
jgi:hypothetical protein